MVCLTVLLTTQLTFVRVGKVLAVGDETGIVTLYNVEDGSLNRSWDVSAGHAILWLDWSSHDDSVSTTVYFCFPRDVLTACRFTLIL